MAFSLSPSVEFTEDDLTQFITGTSSSTGGMVGNFAWGPINEVRRINSEENLVEVFGKPNQANFADWFTAANFLAYTTNLKAVRVSDTGKTAINARMYGVLAADPKTGTLKQIDNETDFTTNEFGAEEGQVNFGVPFIARYGGVFGNDIKVSYAQAAEFATWAYKSSFAEAPTGFEMAVIVLVKDEIVETFSVSTKSGFKDGFGQNNFIDDVINAQSTFIYSFSYHLYTSTFQFESSTGHILNELTTAGTPDTGATIDITAGSTSAALATNATVGIDNYHVVGTKLEVVEGANIGEVYTIVASTDDAGGNWTFTLDRKAVATQSLSFILDATPISVIEENRFVSTNFGNTATDSKIGRLETFQDGSDTSFPTAAEYISSWGLMDSAEEQDISLVMEAGGDSQKLIAAHLISNVCEVRKDCVAFISPDIEDVVGSATPVTNLIATRDALPSSSYAFFDGNYKYQYDRYNDTFRWVPFNGDIAGLCARTDESNDPWWSPAGYNRGIIKSVTKIAFSNSKKAQRDDMYVKQINPIIQESGSGTLLLGDKTMQAKNSAFSFINVRRLFIVLEKSISNAAKFNLFEFNDEFTRGRFVQTVAPFLRDVQSRRGITDFKVIADTTVNTPQVVNAAEFRANILVKPNRSINFIKLTFTAVAEGVSFDEIVAV